MSFKLNSNVSRVVSLVNDLPNKIKVGTTALTSEEVLWSYSLPAATLNADGKGIRITGTISYGLNTNTKTTKVYFGSTSLTANPTTTAPNGLSHSFQFVVVRRSATTQYAYFAQNNLSGTPQSIALDAYPTETLSNAVTLQITGTNGTAVANDIVLTGVRVESFVFKSEVGLFDTSIAATSLNASAASGVTSVVGDGSATSPSYSFASDSDTGFYKSGLGAVTMSLDGTGRFRWGTNVAMASDAELQWLSTANIATGTADTILTRDAANTLAQRNGTNAQEFRVYNTFTSAANNEYGLFGWSGNVLRIGSTFNAPGAARAVNIVAGGSSVWQFTTAGHFVALADNTYDIGGTANAVQNIYSRSNLYLLASSSTGTRLLGNASDGVLALMNFAGTDFARLQFGGTTSSFPAIRRAGTVAEFVLADASAFSGVKALDIDLVGANAFKLNNKVGISATAPTITSAGTSPSVTGSNGTATFRVNVGTGGTATTIVLAMPAATTGWNCNGSNITAAAANRNPTGVLLQQSSTTTAATMQYQTVATGAALAFTASDIVQISCIAY